MRMDMQKLERRNTYTPTDTPQVRSNCDLVRYNKEKQRVKGVHCLGSRVILDNKKSVGINKIELINYGKGLQFN